MDIKAIRQIVNSQDLSEDDKRTLIVRTIANDKNVIPDVLKILSAERDDNKRVIIDMNAELSRAHIYIDQRPEVKSEAKDAFNKGFILDEISKFYIKYKGVVTHCFNRFN